MNLFVIFKLHLLFYVFFKYCFHSHTLHVFIHMNLGIKSEHILMYEIDTNHLGESFSSKVNAM